MAFAGAASEERQEVTEEMASEMACAFLLLINAFPDSDSRNVEKQNLLFPLPSELIICCPLLSQKAAAHRAFCLTLQLC